jgi:hypothetical protein
MPVKPIIATNPQTGEKLQLVNNAWVPVQDPSSQIPKIDPSTFRDARASIEDIQGLKGRATPWTTGFAAQTLGRIGGTPAYDFNVDIDPIRARGMLGRLKELKQESATGASGLGALNQSEGDALKAAAGNIDPLQSTGSFNKNLGRVEELLIRSTPGVTEKNPIDLSKGQSRKLIPQGAYYKDKDGNIRRNDNMDAGNPIIVPRGGNVASQVKAKTGSNNLKAKYGLE